MHLSLALEVTDDDFHNATSVICTEYSPQRQPYSSQIKIAAARCVDACLYCLYTLKQVICAQLKLHARHNKNSSRKKTPTKGAKSIIDHTISSNSVGNNKQDNC